MPQYRYSPLLCNQYGQAVFIHTPERFLRPFRFKCLFLSNLNKAFFANHLHFCIHEEGRTYNKKTAYPLQAGRFFNLSINYQLKRVNRFAQVINRNAFFCQQVRNDTCTCR